MIPENKNTKTQSRRPLAPSPVQDWSKQMERTATKVLATTALITTLWSAPSVPFFHEHHPPAAAAKEMASGSGSRVNKDPESLLRYGLPIKNAEVSYSSLRTSHNDLSLTHTHATHHTTLHHTPSLDSQVRKLQGKLEDIKINVGSKRKGPALDDVKKATAMLTKPDKLTSACREASVCKTEIEKIQTALDGPLTVALKDSMDAFQGSEQERNALDRAYKAQEQTTDSLNIIEEQMIPAGYKTIVPQEYKDLAQLQGRATVEMVLQKSDKSNFDINGKTYKQANLKMIIDGYASPVTSGNFIDLVQKGFYNNMLIQRSDGFVVQTGDPDGEADGYVGKAGAALGNGKHGERLIPLEISVVGDAGPFYESSIEDEGRGGQATVLPFSSFGAMGWAREEYDANSGSSQFFWLPFDSDLTPAGKNVLDGRYPW
jgi:peptidylprolyl isomerase